MEMNFAFLEKKQEYELFEQYCKQVKMSKSKVIKERIADIIKIKE